MYRNGIDICTEVGLITKHVPKWMSFCTDMVMYRNGTPLVPKRTCTEQDPTRLDVRRIRADLMLTYKILFGHLRVDSSQFFIASDVKRTRGHNYKLRVPNAKTDTRKLFFSCRVVKIWNELPKTVNVFSARSFSNCIEKLDFLSYCIKL